ncbi:S1 family peptidase [Sphaerisporangium fuscum]|uniref:S1 family peptidase n=1 Tax=Sphaerisporangium fuscum TaxID=2835868 RepID=UPI0027E2F807|nr:serine protease [Sphaerisporangium fuscum]
MNGKIRKSLTMVAAGASIALSMTAVAAPAVADGETPNVPVGTRLAAQAHPAVQLTSLTYTGQVVVPTPEIKQAAMQALAQQAANAAITGKIAQDERSIAKYIFQKMAADPNTFLRAAGPNRSVDAEVGGLCTGWWVTPDGYMVTGAHCVETGEEELGQLFAQQALEKFNKEDAATVLKELGDYQTDEEIVKLATQLFVTFNSTHLRIQGLQKSLSVLQSLPGGGVDKTAKPVPAELVSVGESYPGKDFALLKVNGQQNLPTVPLGDDADVQTGDTLYISGFPGLVTNTPFFSLESKLDPALTEGPYSAKRTTQTGVPYIQTQAPAYHGNSGGPVFSKDGKVIGMLIAGSVTEGGENTETQTFVLPVGIIKEKLNEKNVKPAQGLTSTRWNEALDDYFRHYYSRALPKFREVQALFPNHPYVAKYISDTQQAISSGKDQTPSSTLPWILIGGGALVGVGIVVVLVMAAGRRRKAATGRPYPQQQAYAVPQQQWQPQPQAALPYPGAQQGGPQQQGLPPHGMPPQGYQGPQGGFPGRPGPQPPQAEQPQQQIADLERELAELRRQLGNQP